MPGPLSTSATIPHRRRVEARTASHCRDRGPYEPTIVFGRDSRGRNHPTQHSGCQAERLGLPQDQATSLALSFQTFPRRDDKRRACSSAHDGWSGFPLHPNRPHRAGGLLEVLGGQDSRDTRALKTVRIDGACQSKSPVERRCRGAMWGLQRSRGRVCVYFRPGPASRPDLRIGRVHDNRSKC
jgi:hypothetical protein